MRFMKIKIFGFLRNQETIELCHSIALETLYAAFQQVKHIQRF